MIVCSGLSASTNKPTPPQLTVDISLLVHALAGLLGLARGIVLALLSIRVGLDALEESILGRLDVLGLTLPRLQDSVLRGFMGCKFKDSKGGKSNGIFIEV